MHKTFIIVQKLRWLSRQRRIETTLPHQRLKNVSAPRKDRRPHAVEGYKVFDSLAYARSPLQSVRPPSAFLRATTFLSYFLTEVISIRIAIQSPLQSCQSSL